MKKQLLTAIAVVLSLCGYAQTKGTSTLGLGANVSTHKSSSSYNNTNENTNQNKNRYFNLGYGYFIKDNARLGLEFSYGVNENNQKNGEFTNTNEAKTYGGNVSYQKYFPIVKTFFAYAGGTGGYAYTKSSNKNSNPNSNTIEENTYNIGAYGGLTWFLSKRFAFETNLLSANILYRESENKGENTNYQNKQKTTDFGLNTRGFIDDLGFKIYLLF